MTTAEIELAPGNVKAAMREAAAGSSDLWKVPRTSIRVLPGFNVRTENDEYLAHIASIGESILANGYRQDKPLAGYVAKEGDENIIYLTDGHSRLRAVDYAIERGAELEKLPVVVSPAGTSMTDLAVGLVTSNSGKPLTPLEKAEVCKRLIGYGMEEDEIAKRLGFTKQYVSDLLLLSGANKAVKAMVGSGGVSASNAVEALKKHGANAADMLQGKLGEAKVAGKSKVTKRTLAPKRDLLAEGIEFIRTGWAEQPDQRLVGLLALLTGTPAADISGRVEAA